MRQAMLLMLALAVTDGRGVAQTGAPSGGLDGAWGGDRIRLVASARDLRLQIDCLAGHVESPVTLDKGGTFRVSLRLAPMRGVERDGGEPDASLAEITGAVTKDAMRLTVGPAGRDGAGVYQLTRGGKATLPNCRFRS